MWWLSELYYARRLDDGGDGGGGSLMQSLPRVFDDEFQHSASAKLCGWILDSYIRL